MYSSPSGGRAGGFLNGDPDARDSGAGAGERVALDRARDEWTPIRRARSASEPMARRSRTKRVWRSHPHSTNSAAVHSTDFGTPATAPRMRLVALAGGVPPSTGRTASAMPIPDRPGGRGDKERLQTAVSDDQPVDSTDHGAEGRAWPTVRGRPPAFHPAGNGQDRVATEIVPPMDRSIPLLNRLSV